MYYVLFYYPMNRASNISNENNRIFETFDNTKQLTNITKIYRDVEKENSICK